MNIYDHSNGRRRTGCIVATVFCAGLVGCNGSNAIDPLVNLIVTAFKKNMTDDSVADSQKTAEKKTTLKTNPLMLVEQVTVQAANSPSPTTPVPDAIGQDVTLAADVGSTPGNNPSDGGSTSQVAKTPVKVRQFIHPGLLQRQADFTRVTKQIAAGAEPTVSGWQKLIKNGHASLEYKPRPVPVVYRGDDGIHSQNYSLLFNDAAAAYALSLRWKISGDSAYAAKAVEVLNSWSSVLTDVNGTSDKYLAAGIYGYQLANAAEILRAYSGWSIGDFSRFQSRMLTVFYPMNHDFLVRHNGARIDHYWANWDLSNLASMIAIGVLTDRVDIYTEAIDYLYHGGGNGALRKTFWKVYDGGLAQVQESGRDQGHTTLDIALVGAICQMAWSQGDDLYGYDNNLVLAGAEYVAKYNLGYDVPYTTYINSDVTQGTISAVGRGTERPIWDMLFNHYVVLKGLDAPNVSIFASKLRPEGGGGDYGPNSGGYDQLGYGTLLYTLD